MAPEIAGSKSFRDFEKRTPVVKQASVLLSLFFTSNFLVVPHNLGVTKGRLPDRITPLLPSGVKKPVKPNQADNATKLSTFSFLDRLERFGIFTLT